jgi:lipoprotein NlpI
VGVGAALLAAAPLAGVAQPGSLPVPDEVLDGLEVSPDVVQQIVFLDRVVRRLEREAPGSAELAEAVEALGHLYLHWELVAPARSCYRVGRRLHPRQLRWPYYLGVVATLEGRQEEALEQLEEALRIDALDVPTLLRLGELELELGRAESAESRFRTALDVDERSAAAWHGLGRAAAARGDDELAVQSFERALELAPAARSLHYPLAQALRRLGRVDQARAHLERFGTGEVPRHDPLVERLGRMSGTASLNLVKALAHRRQVFSDREYTSYTLGFLARLPVAAERLATDLEAWPQELRERDRQARGRLHLAVAALLRTQGDETAARRHWVEAAELLPDLEDELWLVIGARAGAQEPGPTGDQR